ncbi:tRNA lysidine(34) synthetase TilS [Luteimonas marina]|uniref:tRNA(Ile)-lysidine synthase n=1 Tax=Luteimonas marina TaxID=488485 RepID=A0A5C5TTN1_9GAMM|nr:tRNA lysidine(34) synthetase TilS [Luteimonas marina]TWT17563.1 tRNA lysidine(34) synthetase TilS [Luteimonas marina]
MTFPLTWPDDAPAAANAPLLVGYSGGLDSTVLLQRLAGDAALRARGLRAIHVHHGLHDDADAWAAHCAQACAALDVPLDVVRVRVARDGDGLEAAARGARHAAFESALANGEVLALAHHRDDQAETFLLRALRASGVDGLAAMRAWRRFGRGWLWRPLLDVPRQALRDHALAHGLRWIEDPSNGDDAHDRNFLRLHVMPTLHARWPQADAAFARAAGLQREAAGLLSEADAQALAVARTLDPRCLQVAPLASLPGARQARVLRQWLDEAGLPPLPAEGVARIVRQLLGNAPGEAAEFAWRGAVVRRWRDLLWAGPVLPPAPAGVRIGWDGAMPLPWPGGGTLALDIVQPADGGSGADAAAGIATPFVVHARTGGERITLPGRRHSHALKHVLQDLGVPPWIRARLPLLCDREGTVLAAGHLAFSAGFDAWLRATGRRLHWSGLAAT